MKYKLINFSEIDKYAIMSYCKIFEALAPLNLGDITRINETELKDFDMMTWGFPCTDISLAGKKGGGSLMKKENKQEVAYIMKELEYFVRKNRKFLSLKT